MRPALDFVEHTEDGACIVDDRVGEKLIYKFHYIRYSQHGNKDGEYL